MPIVTTPALYHQQKIKSTAAFIIILLKKVTGVLHKTTYLTRQKHLRQDIPIVVEVLGMCSIADRNTDRSTRRTTFHSKTDRRKRLCRLLTQATEAEIARSEVVLATEKESVGIDTPHIIVYGNLANTGFQFSLIKGKRCRSAGRNSQEVEHNAIVHHSHAKFFGGRTAHRPNLYLSIPCPIVHDLQCHTIHIGAWKFLFCRTLLAGIGHGICLSALRREHK